MAEKKASTAAEKKASTVAEKKASIKKSSIARAAASEGDAASALGLTPERPTGSIGSKRSSGEVGDKGIACEAVLGSLRGSIATSWITATGN